MTYTQHTYTKKEQRHQSGIPPGVNPTPGFWKIWSHFFIWPVDTPWHYFRVAISLYTSFTKFRQSVDCRRRRRAPINAKNGANLPKFIPPRIDSGRDDWKWGGLLHPPKVFHCERHFNDKISDTVEYLSFVLAHEQYLRSRTQCFINEGMSQKRDLRSRITEITYRIKNSLDMKECSKYSISQLYMFFVMQFWVTKYMWVTQKCYLAAV